ncbi:hypothetical protein EGI22_23085 [Lacihabitans sp. LS3-19]|uniref:hypothetical protein n=1 Tax=Lacihabitans sp. LS3-19 TaxID=2487335 RepID=UPI0020CBD472|nr:hypothetical protein [Lacihabitans sp. LS3-19]MCP9770799.1 hypothetical protein [Lacihabitans sp. LS3-19]
MKKQFRAIILVLALGTFSANAQAGINTKVSGDKLTASSANEFSTFVNTKARKVSRKNDVDLKKYLEVVNLYHNSPVAFFNLDEANKAEFNNASALLSEKLNGMRKKEAKNWAKSIQLNKSVFQFIWSNRNTPTNVIEITPAQALVDAVTSL